MMYEEAKLIGKEIRLIQNDPKVKNILDIGSSTHEFRTKIQPYIYKEIFSKLKNKKISHLDQKKAEGIDIVCTIDNLGKINQKFDAIFCFNLLEHVKNIEKVAKDIINLLNATGHLFVTVPLSYPYHPDYIDTMFRPTESELQEMFKPLKMINYKIISTTPNNSKIRLYVWSFYRLIKDFKMKYFIKNVKYMFQGPKVLYVHFKA